MIFVKCLKYYRWVCFWWNINKQLLNTVEIEMMVLKKWTEIELNAARFTCQLSTQVKAKDLLLSGPLHTFTFSCSLFRFICQLSLWSLKATDQHGQSPDVPSQTFHNPTNTNWPCSIGKNKRDQCQQMLTGVTLIWQNQTMSNAAGQCLSVQYELAFSLCHDVRTDNTLSLSYVGVIYCVLQLIVLL